MPWVKGGLVVVIGALVFRRVLRLGSRGSDGLTFRRLAPEYQSISAMVETELETQITMLNVTLNDAIEERNSGRADTAWHLVNLASSQWKPAADLVGSLLEILRKNVSYARVPVSYKGPFIQSFKSQTLIDHLRLHEFLTQLVFRSKLRFYLQVDMLRRAATSLVAEFERTARYGEITEDCSPEVWQRLDYCLHDLDVLAKESSLALRACLVRLPVSALNSLRRDVEAVLRKGVRGASVPAGK